MSYWSHFVTNGAPKAAGLPDWPAQDGNPDHNFWMSLRPGGSQVGTDSGVTPVPVLVDAERRIVSAPIRTASPHEWAAAWNRRDVDAVLAHSHDDVVLHLAGRGPKWSPNQREWCHGRAAPARILCAGIGGRARPALRGRGVYGSGARFW